MYKTRNTEMQKNNKIVKENKCGENKKKMIKDEEISQKERKEILTKTPSLIILDTLR